jgi:hypothetical protein
VSSIRVTQNSDGGWRVERDGIVIADGLSNAAAWREADRLDTEAEGMEETRRRISIAVGQW